MRTEFPARGFLGGKPGTTREFIVDGKPVPPKGRLELKPGETFTIAEAGGGGFGDPLKRDLTRVLDDVRSGAVSVEGALRDYGVTVDISNESAIRA
jgi:N-methylhydantoinase B